jgi:hypothetical protein
VAVPPEVVTTELATKVPPAPLSVKFTVTPVTPNPCASNTFTTKGAANGVLGSAVWALPEEMANLDGGPTAAVSLNTALT